MAGEHRRNWLAHGLVVALLVVGIGASVPTASAGAGTLLLVFPPWWDHEAVWRAALSTGDVVAEVSSFALVLHSDAEGFAARARGAGALMVLDPGIQPCGGSREGEVG